MASSETLKFVVKTKANSSQNITPLCIVVTTKNNFSILPKSDLKKMYREILSTIIWSTVANSLTCKFGLNFVKIGF